MRYPRQDPEPHDVLVSRNLHDLSDSILDTLWAFGLARLIIFYSQKISETIEPPRLNTKWAPEIMR
jgi:hypothetical protein